MRAVVVDAFGAPPAVREWPDPVPGPGDVVLRVLATGLCRSDWHGWVGHDPGIPLPYVPGHEYAGVVEAVGGAVRRLNVGDVVTVPFVCACGSCECCRAGQHQVCPTQRQPGFTEDGSFAELVRVPHADVNVIPLPEGFDPVVAAALGCRTATAFRAVRDRGAVRPGEWLAVHGCGGVGLSAVMIAAALGARVVAVDVSPAALDLATDLGAEITVLAGSADDVGLGDVGSGAVGAEVRDRTGGGVQVSLDAFGSVATATASIESLRRLGRHVQVGLLPDAAGRPPLPMERVVGHELTLLGSHGMSPLDYPALLDLVATGALPIRRAVTGSLTLDEVPAALMALGRATPAGIRVIRP